MKTVMSVLALSALFLLAPAFGQEKGPGRIAILPLSSNGVDAVTVETAESILRTEISKQSSMDIVSGRKTKEALGDAGCAESECAAAAGQTLGAAQVLGCRLSALGEKIIVQYFLVDVPTRKQILIDQATAATTEDLEVLMKRLAKSVVDLEPISRSAEVGQILATESTEPPRRATRKNFGFSFGYLYPQHGYDNGSRSFIVDSRFDYEIDDYAVGMLVGIRKGFAADLYGAYLLSRRDVCPYLGAGVGFHWISHNTLFNFSGVPDNRRGDGLEVSAITGLRLLHTYNFQMILNLEFIYTMNDYDDRAVVFTIGIL